MKREGVSILDAGNRPVGNRPALPRMSAVPNHPRPTSFSAPTPVFQPLYLRWPSHAGLCALLALSVRGLSAIEDAQAVPRLEEILVEGIDARTDTRVLSNPRGAVHVQGVAKQTCAL